MFQGVVIVDSSIDRFLQTDGSPETLFFRNTELIKSHGSTRTALVEMSPSNSASAPPDLFVKAFYNKSPLHSFKHPFRKHRAQTQWQISWHLLEHGVLVPEPMGYLIKQKGLFWREGYFFSEALSGCDNLGTLAKNDKGLSDRLDSGALIEALAGAIALLHDSGVTHGDLKWSNILVHGKRNEPWFVDLDAAKLRGRFLGPGYVARDLARFVLSGVEAGTDASIINRFLDEYALRRKVTRESLHRPVTRVLRKLKKRHKKKLRK